MIISEVLSISLDQQIVYQNDMNKTWLYTHIMSRTVHLTCCLTLFQYEIHSRMTVCDDEIRLLGPSSADSSELDVLESL